MDARLRKARLDKLLHDVPSEPASYFTYGSLMPGQRRWLALQPYAERLTRATVRGRLYRVPGADYPAARFDGDGVIEGWVVEFRPTEVDEALDVVAAVHNARFLPVCVRTLEDAGAVAFDWRGPMRHLRPISRWTGS